MSDLILLHHSRSGHSKSQGSMSVKAVAPGTYWGTCLREMAFIRSDDIRNMEPSSLLAQMISENSLQVHENHDVYQVLLEVICGLQSPLIGETEVMGQFKEFFQNLKDEHLTVRKLCESVFADAKIIRERHLQKLGGQSYGSLARCYLQDVPAVSLIGSGHLACEILPWLSKKSRVTVYSRSEEKKKILKEKFPFIELKNLGDLKSETAKALIVAAPIRSGELDGWIERYDKSYEVILDFRCVAKSDLLNPTLGAKIISLEEIFGRLDAQKQEALDRVAEAKREILELTKNYGARAEMRPFGWDDL